MYFQKINFWEKRNCVFQRGNFYKRKSRNPVFNLLFLYETSLPFISFFLPRIILEIKIVFLLMSNRGCGIEISTDNWRITRRWGFPGKGRRRAKPIVPLLTGPPRCWSGPIETRTWKHYKCGVTPATSRKRSLLGVTGPARSLGGRTSGRRKSEDGKEGRRSSWAPFPFQEGPAIVSRCVRTRVRCAYPCVCACTLAPKENAFCQLPTLASHRTLLFAINENSGAYL